MSRSQIPNAITLLRLLLGAGCFVALEGYRFGTNDPKWLLPLAILLFIAAAATDALDGHLARKWQVESRFGRIMDPFCDKMLIIGAFLFLASGHLAAATGVAPWMVVAVLARELLVTGIRDEMEGSGVKFGANWSGKAKMIAQSIAIPTILAIVWWMDKAPWLPEIPAFMAHVKTGLVWLTVAITLLSGVPYLTAALKNMGAK
jgi:CDP-diacylglycerol--glycerol-3-phosphate 3-phosphatidyltransferase